MNSTALRRALARLGMTQVGLARTLKVNAATVRRWISGASPIPEAVALLLKEWLASGRKR
jgi:DNA-binding transcriptional regulator YiaG